MRRFKPVLSSKTAKKLGIITGVLASIGGITIALNWTYLRRLATYPKQQPITTVDWYQPLEAVPGDPAPLAKASSPLAQSGLPEITEYAEAINSSALLVMHQGKLVGESYWGDFNSSSTFNSMSLSKTIVALLIGIAIAEGHITSELDPVAKYLPFWSGDERQDITIQDLLYMQSGLRNQDNTANPFSDLVRMYAGTQVNQIALNLPVVRPPQQAYDYNNVNTQILSQVLEASTGERYARYLSTRLWQPLQGSNADLWLDRPQGDPKVFCCLFATPQDWVKVGQLFLDGGQVDGQQVVPAEWIAKMVQPSPLNDDYGYHIWLKPQINNYKPRASDLPGKGAFINQSTFFLDGASRQRVYIIPEQELVIVRVGEEPPQWDDAFMPNTLVKSLQAIK
ncbi:MAG: serine hydrolase [Cyanobacteria bacterium J06621_8]